MEDVLKVKGKDGLVKDPSTGAVVNVDDGAYLAAKRAKRRVLEEKQKQLQLESRIDQLELLVTKFLEKEMTNG